MRAISVSAAILLACFSSFGALPPESGSTILLFNGRTLNGWEGNTNLWRVQDGCITGGSLIETITHNDFLCTTRDFTNFILRLKVKLTGTSGFINSGIQVRSRRVPNDHEVAGYQCDIGDPDWWGTIYDEARRNRVLFPTDMIALEPALRRGDWNDYVIRADGPRLTLWINNVQTADYYEDDAGIATAGVIGIQVHGGGKALVQVKDVTVEQLPPTAANARFLAAPAPAKPAKAPPLAPAEQQATFTLPPGFDIELVASEAEGVGKPITVVWDATGRMWTMTAFEYPVDANDNKEIAAALYKEPRRVRVLVFDNPYGPGPHQPRVFADGFAIPLGLLPYKDGAFVQHGSDILFLRDTDQDGRADQREAVLTGFGIGDSHLLPHQFTRAPGGWILVAQGAFNNSLVRTKSGETFEFNRTLLGRFTPDGMKFETIGWGPCNIWGLVLDQQGEVFIQEANDYGYPVMPFHVGASYPGCTPFPKPYAPTFPGLSRLGMGGTGLSGLALSDARGSFPGAYADVFYVANPVMQRIQAVKLIRDGAHYSLIKLPDFVRTSDEWFRPVAIHFGPDGCLYIVDWYNKVISHNEVARNHPDRDKTRGRIWRVRHKDQPSHRRLDFAKMPDADLLPYLGADSQWASHTAWQQIVDRHAVALAPRLEQLVRDARKPVAARIQALWAIEGLQRATAELVQPLLREADRNLRREAVRVMGAGKFPASELISNLERLAEDADPEVRAEVIRSAAPLVGKEPRALGLLMRMGHEPLQGPVARNTQNGKPIKVREAYDRDFERYLIRATLEKHPSAVAEFLSSASARGLPVENQVFAALALEPKTSAAQVARLLPALKRPPGEEELLRLAQFLDEAGVGDALKAVLQTPVTRMEAAEALLRGRTRLDVTRLKPLVADAATALLEGDAAAQALGVRLASGFQIKTLEPLLARAVARPNLAATQQLSVLRALREIGSERTDLFAGLATQSPDPTVRNEAVLALASASVPNATERLFALWPKLNLSLRRSALDQLASSRSGAQSIVAAATTGSLAKSELDTGLLDKLVAVLGDHAELKTLIDQMGATVRSVLRLDGRKESYVDSNITLEGPFTVETWIRLDPGISNDDGILGHAGSADFNFHDGRLRVFGGQEYGDRIVAKRAMTPDLWTHVAVTRDAGGAFRIYLDGELDNADSRPLKETFPNLDIGRVIPVKAGTSAMLAEYRVWNRCRAADEIRADFDRSFEGEARPSGLVHYFPAAGPWGKLNGTASIVRTLDPPPLLTAAEARSQAEKFGKFRELAEKAGDPTRGKALAVACTVCHVIQGQGGAIGPNLSGAGAMSLEALLRSILTPNAAMEAGYRIFRVEVDGEEIIDGFLVSQDNQALVLRIPNSEDRRIAKEKIRRASFIRRSLMPEGLLEALPSQDVTDLFAYLKTLR